MKTIANQLDEARRRCSEALGYLRGADSDPALHGIIEDIAVRIGRVRRELSTGTHRYDARELSCQGLTLVDSASVTFHGYEVEGYHEEMRRRGEIHVWSCDVTGHIPARGDASAGCLSCDPGSGVPSPPICVSCTEQGVTLDSLKTATP